jgi:acyl-coenzyme A synthetase/AMP-(fatty) acid ligase
MPSSKRTSLWDFLSAVEGVSDRVLQGAEASVALGDLVRGSSLGGRLEELRGRAVLVATADQLTAALALIELDGVVRRLVLCPPDLPLEHVPFIIATAAVDAIVSDRTAPETGMPTPGPWVICSLEFTATDFERAAQYKTEWILLTSGTTGPPKMVVHSLSSLTGAIKTGRAAAQAALWSTFYDIRRYGGLQVLLRAILGGGSLVLSDARESVGEFLIRAAGLRVTHILGTPTHWRSTLMSPSARGLAPQYVRLSGEIADQAILDHLRTFYPGATIVHAFASTEAGVAFEVGDGIAGFPAQLVGRRDAEVEMEVEDGSLRIRSARTATRYLGNDGESLANAEGFVDTGDMVELRADRYYFVGRKGGIINVGGLKIHPEEVEAVINSHPEVRVSLVRARKNAITGALAVADVVLIADPGPAGARRNALQREILQLCRAALPAHKVPVAINFVPSLDVAPTGKIARRNA